MDATKEQFKNIEAQWRSRAKSQGFKFGTKKYSHAECEFFVGAMATLKALGCANWGNAVWCLNLMSGREIAPKDGPIADEEDGFVKVPTTKEAAPGDPDA